ncbi:MAG: 50S ribosomal protein L6 [Candidatus Moranbacteria bacterium CG23_combo_of_CG06-09_8_20_14_all_39_10]|nr:MAG: 50S ribosomal protein L6 [Candidatus Moranbacteria bacterium CG23_combo_of_CG06-09_8_20_14_all_39_10]
MSRIGKKIITIPAGVEVKLQNDKLEVKGPKGTLSFACHKEVALEITDKEISVKNVGKSKKAPALWGMTRAMISNMVEGVNEMYIKKLELQGVGFRMAVAGKKINMALGFSHPVNVDVPEGLEAKIEEGVLVITGIDKQAVGQFAAEIRGLKPVEPYKGKGFRYVGEYVRRKAGKKAASK